MRIIDNIKFALSRIRHGWAPGDQADTVSYVAGILAEMLHYLSKNAHGHPMLFCPGDNPFADHDSDLCQAAWEAELRHGAELFRFLHECDEFDLMPGWHEAVESNCPIDYHSFDLGKANDKYQMVADAATEWLGMYWNYIWD